MLRVTPEEVVVDTRLQLSSNDTLTNKVMTSSPGLEHSPYQGSCNLITTYIFSNMVKLASMLYNNYNTNTNTYTIELHYRN